MNRLYICCAQEKQYRTLVEESSLEQLTITDQLENANIVLGDPAWFAPHLSAAHQLQWMQSTFAGCDALLAHSKKDYLLTNVRGFFGPLMSEYIFGQLFNLTRHFSQYKQWQKQELWYPLPYKSVQQMTMVILGTGDTGSHLAKTARHFSMKTIGINRKGRNVSEFDKIVTLKDMPAAFACADVIVATLPATKQTTGLINKSNLSHCNNALFFNVGRANIVAEKDLIDALEKRYIRHAVLDVFLTEPLAANHPFWHHDAITVTPHICAHSFPQKVFEIFSKNYQFWCKKKTLDFLIDFKQGY